MLQDIATRDLKARLDAGEDIILVEALPYRHFADKHLPGAVNIPHEDIHKRAAELLPDKNASIVVYCANTACQNSRIAAMALVQQGYSNVFEFVDGKQAWEDAGYPFAS